MNHEVSSYRLRLTTTNVEVIQSERAHLHDKLFVQSVDENVLLIETLMVPVLLVPWRLWPVGSDGMGSSSG